MISVLIPTFNRRPILQRTLAALLAQDEASDAFEIIVVDDGSADETREAVVDLAGRSPVNLCYLQQENSGAGAARSRGIGHAKGTIVLLLDDDIIASPQQLREHRRSHERYPQPNVDILGRVGLSPEIPDTPLNRRHAVHRWQLLWDGQEVDWRHFCTGNSSLKRPSCAGWGVGSTKACLTTWTRKWATAAANTASGSSTRPTL
jgi:glycosyltransferase involved in cell wall biosynthesis